MLLVDFGAVVLAPDDFEPALFGLLEAGLLLGGVDLPEGVSDFLAILQNPGAAMEHGAAQRIIAHMV